MGDCSAQVGGAASGVQHYTAFGEVRSRGGEMPTAYQYTGQLSQMEAVGLYHYGARWFDPYLNHMLSPDTIIPDQYNSLDYDLYAYTRSNPIKYTDPSGHAVACVNDVGNGCDGFGPSSIVQAGYDPEQTDEYLIRFMEARPDYRVEKDPVVYMKNAEVLVRNAQFQVEAEKPQDLGDWTFQIGFGGMLFVGGLNVRGDLSLGVDGKGNIGRFASLGGGGDTTIGTNIGFFITVTDAPSLDKLLGKSVQMGGQVGTGASVSREIEIFSDSATGKIYKGTSIGGGAQDCASLFL